MNGKHLILDIATTATAAVFMPASVAVGVGVLVTYALGKTFSRRGLTGRSANRNRRSN